ncbi:CaiB/BaiF CoA transferase family protein [Variovorax sp. M-6]|uniref:CaiB/BaiF CoA transferase family protein n=1 Tax=Variovorax sp. M-6 TaxID=3233041 RepID=UPI003F9CC0D0
MNSPHPPDASLSPSTAPPLAGYKVVDMSTVLMGPVATQVLGDYGADVIKVEPPDGDVMRHAGAARTSRMGAMYLANGRNKRSIVLDIKQPEGKRALLRLCESADLFIHNVRPAAMQRAGLGYDDLRAVNPSIVYVSLVGYGERGPYANQPALDDIIQAGAGVCGLFVRAGLDEPVFVPLTMADRLTGTTAAHAAIAGLLRRERTGLGQAIEVPMFETLVQAVLGDHLNGKAFLPAIDDSGYGRLLTPHRRPYKTLDGYIAATPYNDKQFRAFYTAIGRAEAFDGNALLATQSARARNYHATYAELAQIIATRTTDEWIALCRAHEVPCARVNSIDDLLDDPHLQAVDFFEEGEHPTEGRIRQMRPSTQWSSADVSIRRHPPRIGEQSVEVLRDAGYSAAEIDALLASGVTLDGRCPAGEG